VATNSDRAAEQRRIKLEEIDRQIKGGTLRVREMTAAERKLNPPVPRKGYRGPR
jgi:hypothetical protein